jgi:hypothetical protein
MKVAKAKAKAKAKDGWGKQPKLQPPPGSPPRLDGAQWRVQHPRSRRTLFGVGRSTVYRAIERQRVEARAGLAEATSKR